MKLEIFTNIIKINIAMRKEIVVSLFALALSYGFLHAQNDTMYVMKLGIVVDKYNVNTEVDSVIFYNPNTITNPINLMLADIPADTFIMGSPNNEAGRDGDESQHQVTLSAFKMSKYEITNTQYAAFLNAKGIGSNGIFTEGAFPDQALIHASDWGLQYTNKHWVPVAGYENHPVIYVTWYGATEFATYAGGRLPTEAEWEFACRAAATTTFNTGNCLSDEQANYDWGYQYSTCTNTNTIYPGTTQAVGTYPANAYGLHDMHGNVWEWCSDWYGTYSTADQTNPRGAPSGQKRVLRGGSWDYSARWCRSAFRVDYDPSGYGGSLFTGFRVVLLP
jgi:sulfatase modifying factor 1